MPLKVEVLAIGHSNDVLPFPAVKGMIEFPNISAG
jgi:hypothetical protein